MSFCLSLFALYAAAADLHPEGADGAPLDVSGKVVVLNFWASWCGPCRAELPLLEDLQQHLDADRATVVGVNLDTGHAGRALARRLDLSLPVVWDPEGAVAGRFQPPAMPTTVLLDGTGHPVATWTGELHEAEVADIRARVDALAPGAVR